MDTVTLKSPIDAVQIGNIIRQMRTTANKDQTALADEIGILQGRMTQFENGRGGTLFEILSKIAAACGYRFSLTFERIKK
jgi:transcriptional regulator with XRE-family HTH domain